MSYELLLDKELRDSISVFITDVGVTLEEFIISEFILFGKTRNKSVIVVQKLQFEVYWNYTTFIYTPFQHKRFLFGSAPNCTDS